jgi:hypothetical protein
VPHIGLAPVPQPDATPFDEAWVLELSHVGSGVEGRNEVRVVIDAKAMRAYAAGGGPRDLVASMAAEAHDVIAKAEGGR